MRVVIFLVADEAVDGFSKVESAAVEELLLAVVCSSVNAPLVNNVLFGVESELDDVVDIGEGVFCIFPIGRDAVLDGADDLVV